MEDNNKTLQAQGKKYNFLFDTSAILYFQVMHQHCRASIFTAISECPEVNFFVLNEVLSELMRGQKGISPLQLNVFLNHILNSESAMDRNRKENRFLVEEDGEIKYIVLSSISATDYAQVLVCQNHPQLVLVANDKKMLQSAAQMLEGRRTVGIPAFLDRLLLLYPKNERVKALKKAGDELFVKKHDFRGEIQQDCKNKEVDLVIHGVSNNRSDSCCQSKLFQANDKSLNLWLELGEILISRRNFAKTLNHYRMERDRAPFGYWPCASLFRSQWSPHLAWRQNRKGSHPRPLQKKPSRFAEYFF